MNSDSDLWRQLAVSACLLRSILRSQTYTWEQHAQLKLQLDNCAQTLAINVPYLIRAVSKGQRGDASHKAFHMFYVQGWNNGDKISDYHWAIMLTSVNYIIKWTKSGLQTAPKANIIRETLYVDFIAIKKQFSMHATAHNRSTCVDVQCNWKLTCGHKKRNKTKTDSIKNEVTIVALRSQLLNLFQRWSTNKTASNWKKN